MKPSEVYSLEIPLKNSDNYHQNNPFSSQLKINPKIPIEDFSENIIAKENQDLSPGGITEGSDFSETKKRPDLFEIHLTQENSTVIPFVRKFISKLKNASSLRNISQLKTENLKLLNDSSHLLDEKLTKNRFSRYMKTYFCSQVKSMIKSMIFVNFLQKYIKTDKILLHPYQNIRLFWDILHLLLIVFWFFYIPAMIAIVELYQSDYPFSFYTVIFLLFDMLLNFNTSYFKNGVQETKRSKIFSNYIATRFYYDLVTILPLAIDMIFDYSMQTDNFRKFHVIHILKFLFFLKISTFQEISNRILEKFLLKEKFQNILALLKVFFVSILVAHLFACFWYLTAEISVLTSQDSWIIKAGLIDSSWNLKYLYSIYWAFVTMMTVGYGDITPQNEIEVIVCMISVVLGCGVYAYNINSIGMILQDLNKENAEFTHKINVINQFMIRKNINKDLQMRIREYLRFIWKEENTQNLEDEQKIIGLLSTSLKEELLIEAYGTVLKKHPMFFTNFSEKSLRKVVSIIKDIKLFPDEKVYLENEEENDFSIFFVMKGKVEIFSDNSEVVIKTLGVGDHFGEIGFFTGKSRLFSVRSCDFTTLFVINREEFIEVLRKNSDDFEKFCMIKDQILLYGNYLPLRIRCFCCNQTGHIASKCPLIHYLPDNEKIIKTYNYYVDQPRDGNFKRKFRKKNARKIKNLLKIANDKIMENSLKDQESSRLELQSNLSSSVDQEKMNDLEEEENKERIISVKILQQDFDKIKEDEEKDDYIEGSCASMNENLKSQRKVNKSSVSSIDSLNNNFINPNNNGNNNGNNNANNNANNYAHNYANNNANHNANNNANNNNDVINNTNAHNNNPLSLEDIKESNINYFKDFNEPNIVMKNLKPFEIGRKHSGSQGNLPEDMKFLRKNTQKQTQIERVGKLTTVAVNSLTNLTNNLTNDNLIGSDLNNLIEKYPLDKVKIFKNYFPENNCKQIFERFNKKKSTSTRYLKKMRSLENKLSKYTFFLDDLKMKMPSEIRKRKKIRQRNEKLKQLDPFNEKNKSLLIKTRKKGLFFNGGEKRTQDLKFTELVKKIMKSPTLKKKLRKNKKGSVF